MNNETISQDVLNLAHHTILLQLSRVVFLRMPAAEREEMLSGMRRIKLPIPENETETQTAMRLEVLKIIQEFWTGFELPQ